MPFSIRLASLLNHVQHIGGLIATEKMLDADTARDVAAVTDEIFGPQRTVVILEYPAVQCDASAADFEFPVATTADRPLPYEASTFRPQTLTENPALKISAPEIAGTKRAVLHRSAQVNLPNIGMRHSGAQAPVPRSPFPQQGGCQVGRKPAHRTAAYRPGAAQILRQWLGRGQHERRSYRVLCGRGAGLELGSARSS